MTWCRKTTFGNPGKHQLFTFFLFKSIEKKYYLVLKTFTFIKVVQYNLLGIFISFLNDN